jgi:hypothetical protein
MDVPPHRSGELWTIPFDMPTFRVQTVMTGLALYLLIHNRRFGPKSRRAEFLGIARFSSQRRFETSASDFSSAWNGKLVKLRYFLGCTMPEAAPVLGIALATAEDDWTYAKAWLRRQWRRDERNGAAE